MRSLSYRAGVVALMAIVIAPLAAVSAATIWTDFERSRRKIAQDRQRLAQVSALALETFIQGQLSTARSLAVHPALAKPLPNPELAEYLKRVRQANPAWEGVGIVGADGYSVFTSQGAKPVYLGDRPYFKEAVRSGEPVVSAALIGRLSSKPTVVLAVPFQDAAGRRGVLTAPLPTEGFAAHLLREAASTGVRLVVVDAEGKTFIDPDAERVRRLHSLAKRPEAAAVLAGKAGTMHVDDEGIQTLVAYAPVPAYGWGVLLSEPSATAYAAANRDAWTRAAVLAALVAAVIGLGWYLGGRLSRSYDDAVAARDALHRDVATRDGFLAAAAHDLRNPLGVVSTAASTLEDMVNRDAARLSPDYSECLLRIRSASRRMAGLLEGFLDVARLQMGHRLELACVEQDITPLVAQLVTEAREAAPRHRIRFNPCPGAVGKVDGPRLQRAVANLLDNAIKYMPQGGEILVVVEVRDAGLVVVVRDRGMGIPSADQSHVLERFGRASNVGSIPGTGIGLFAARQVIEDHGGRLTIESSAGAGTEVTVWLPASATAYADLLPMRKTA